MPQASLNRVSPALAQQVVAVSSVDSLETVELSMALEAQNLVGSGFENAVRNAADAIGAEMLFNIPAPSSMHFQRAALVRLPEDNSELVLITLTEDGSAMNAQRETPETAHLFRLGEAWMAVISQFRKLS